MFYLMIERTMRATHSVLFLAWNEQVDRWFVTPGTTLMKGSQCLPLEGQRYPYYGRFLRLERDQSSSN